MNFSFKNIFRQVLIAMLFLVPLSLAINILFEINVMLTLIFAVVGVAALSVADEFLSGEGSH